MEGEIELLEKDLKNSTLILNNFEKLDSNNYYENEIANRVKAYYDEISKMRKEDTILLS